MGMIRRGNTAALPPRTTTVTQTTTCGTSGRRIPSVGSSLRSVSTSDSYTQSTSYSAPSVSSKLAIAMSGISGSMSKVTAATPSRVPPLLSTSTAPTQSANVSRTTAPFPTSSVSSGSPAVSSVSRPGPSRAVTSGRLSESMTPSLSVAPQSTTVLPASYNSSSPARVINLDDVASDLSTTGISDWLQGGPAVACLRDLDERIDAGGTKVIASGSFGDVRLATDRVSQKQVAVKVLVEQNARKEVNILSRLDHENIVKLVDVMVHRRPLPETSHLGPYLCIVMDYVPNAYTIAKLIFRTGPVDRSLIGWIMRQLSSALATMHAQGIVHRDVWAENVLLEQGTGVVKLVDFGHADFVNGPASQKPLNLPYMSPEAAQKQAQHPGDDCWTMGLLLSELLTGKFMRDRLNGDSEPVHFYEDVLKDLIRDAADHDDTSDRRLSKCCKSLLNMDVTQRLTMNNLNAILSRPMSHSVNDIDAITSSSALGTSPTASGSSARYQSPSTSPTSSLIAGTGSLGRATSVSVVGETFAAGQRIRYVARSNGVSYPGMILGKVSGNGGGWSIRLDVGTTKEVGETDLWRLSSE